MQENFAIANTDMEDEEYNVIEERKDIEENLLISQLLLEEEENQNFISNEFCALAANDDDIYEEQFEDIQKRKDIEEDLLNHQLEEEKMIEYSVDLSNESDASDCDEDFYEEIEKRKDTEEQILTDQIKEEIIDVEYTEKSPSVDDFDEESYEEIENRKEVEEKSLFKLIEEENFEGDIEEIIKSDLIDEYDEESPEEIEHWKEKEECLFSIQIEEENNTVHSDSPMKTEIKPASNINIFPVPDNLSCSSNEEKRSVTSITEIESNTNVPSETPFKHKSMIPVQTGRKIPLPREIFETPSFRTQGRDKFDVHLLSEMKPKAKNNSKGHSSIPVNQGRKQLTKKSITQASKKDIKEEKQPPVRPIHKKTSINKRSTVVNTNNKNNDEDNKNAASKPEKQQPPKTISKKQLKNLTDRLAPVTPAATKQPKSEVSESIKAIPQTPCCSNNPDIFNRLFEMSTCKKKMPSPEEEKVEEVPVEAQPLMSAKSNHLALKKDIIKISNVVGEVDECDKENLERIMKELKIIDSTTTDEELKMIEKEYSQCIIDSEKNIYSAKQLETRILDSLSLKKHRKFNVYVNRRLAIVRANEKVVVVEQKEEKPEPVKCSTTMHRVTFDRLIAVKPTPAPENDNQNANDATLKKETEKVRLSKASQFILQKSQRTQEIMDMPLDQRDNYLTKLRNQSIQKLEESLQQEEEKELKSKPSNLGALPKFYGQIQQELKQRSTKQSQAKKESEKDSSKPKKMSYNDFQKMKEKVYGNEPKIAGVEERIKRLRLARIERNELQEALDPRALPSELKNIKKKKSTVKKNVSLSSSMIQAENQADPSNEIVDVVDSALGI